MIVQWLGVKESFLKVQNLKRFPNISTAITQSKFRFRIYETTGWHRQLRVNGINGVCCHVAQLVEWQATQSVYLWLAVSCWWEVIFDGCHGHTQFGGLCCCLRPRVLLWAIMWVACYQSLTWVPRYTDLQPKTWCWQVEPPLWRSDVKCKKRVKYWAAVTMILKMFVEGFNGRVVTALHTTDCYNCCYLSLCWIPSCDFKLSLGFGQFSKRIKLPKVLFHVTMKWWSFTNQCIQ